MWNIRTLVEDVGGAHICRSRSIGTAVSQPLSRPIDQGVKTIRSVSGCHSGVQVAWQGCVDS